LLMHLHIIIYTHACMQTDFVSVPHAVTLMYVTTTHVQ
jgi:hypothetical protein